MYIIAGLNSDLSVFKTVNKNIGRIFRSKNPRRVGKKGPGVMRLSSGNYGEEHENETSKDLLNTNQTKNQLIESGNSSEQQLLSTSVNLFTNDHASAKSSQNVSTDIGLDKSKAKYDITDFSEHSMYCRIILSHSRCHHSSRISKLTEQKTYRTSGPETN